MEEKKAIAIPLVKAIESGKEQTESMQKCKEMWSRVWAQLNWLIRSYLERYTIDCDSQVGVDQKVDSRLQEYCSLDMEQEDGRHQLPTLNISKVR